MAMVAATNSVIAAGVGDDQQHLRREQREAAADEVDAGGDHRGRVDQGETGVGPSIASGSHTCSGNCADLPTQPRKMPSPATSSQ